jgi:hypothetical protein
MSAGDRVKMVRSRPRGYLSSHRAFLARQPMQLAKARDLSQQKAEGGGLQQTLRLRLRLRGHGASCTGSIYQRKRLVK